MNRQNIREYEVDMPNPVILPDDADLSPVAAQIPNSRNATPHTQTTRNNIQTTQTPAQQQRNSSQTSGKCNCGINTGYKYEFGIVYKKTQQAKNPNTNQIRRDWLYIQLIGNIESDSVQNDRFLIYLK